MKLVRAVQEHAESEGTAIVTLKRMNCCMREKKSPRVRVYSYLERDGLIQSTAILLRIAMKTQVHQFSYHAPQVQILCYLSTDRDRRKQGVHIFVYSSLHGKPCYARGKVYYNDIDSEFMEDV